VSSYSTAIQAHSSRAQYIPYLKSELGDVPVTWSRLPGDVWDTRLRATAMYDPMKAFHLVVQDDVLIGKDFASRLEKVLEHGDDVAYCLFYRWRRVNEALNRTAQRAFRKKADHFIWNTTQWGQAIVLPTKIIEPMFEFWRTHDAPQADRDDTHIGTFLQAIHMDVLYPIPSLVDHRPEAGSLVWPEAARAGTNAKRRATWFR
jgi:hypothetical protein